MARRLRLYSNPIAGRVKPKSSIEMAEQMDTSIASKDSSFIKYVPRNVSPISHVIIPQTSGLDPNAHLTPLKGYQIRFKGKILEKTLRSNTFKFRTGHTRRSDYRSHHYEEGYSVHGPYGSVGVRVYYEYDLEPYFGSNEIYSEEAAAKEAKAKQSKEKDADRFKYKVSDKHDVNKFDLMEDEATQRQLLLSDSEL